MSSVDVTQLELWMQTESENQRLEFKEAKKQFSFDKLKEYCVALANEGGGHLVLGVTDRRPRRVVGTSAFPNVTEKAEQLFRALGFRVDIEELDHRDGRVVVFRIPARPRGTAYELEGRYLMRSGGALVPMSEDRLREIFAEGTPDWLELQCGTGVTREEITQLLDIDAYFALLRMPRPSGTSETLNQLGRDRLIDQDAGLYTIRRMGALLFARDLRDFPDCAGKAARVVVYSSTSKLNTKLDREFTTGYASGFEQLVAFIMEQLPQNEVIRGALRQHVPLVPDAVIRELVANALIHQDLSVRGMNVMIDIHPDRVEISNPGKPLMPVERFIDGYQSRNERLGDLMRRFGICEERSSGIDRVVSTVEAYQLPAPLFHETLNRTEVVVMGPRPFTEMSREDRIRACFQHCALQWVLRQSMTNQTLRDRFGLSEGQSGLTSQIISQTMEAKLVKLDQSVGSSKKYRRYIPFWA